MISFYLIILTSFLMLFYKNTFQLKILLHSYKDFFTDDGVTPLKKGYQLLKMCDANVKG